MRDARAVKQARTLRADATIAEKAMWKYLRREQTGLRFRRQADVGRYIIDFLCHEPPMAVEIDGPVHEEAEQALRDERKDAFLRERGFVVLRIPEKRAREYPHLAVKDILATAARAVAPTPAPPPQAGEGGA
jgi:very-short-patch-repair endonuclease